MDRRMWGRLGLAGLGVVLVAGLYMTWRVVDNTATALDSLSSEQNESPVELAAPSDPAVGAARSERKLSKRKARRARRAAARESAELNPAAANRLRPGLLGPRTLGDDVMSQRAALHKHLQRGEVFELDPDAPSLVAPGGFQPVQARLPVGVVPPEPEPAEVDTGSPK